MCIHCNAVYIIIGLRIIIIIIIVIVVVIIVIIKLLISAATAEYHEFYVIQLNY